MNLTNMQVEIETTLTKEEVTNKLQNMGGKIWVKNEMERIYFNNLGTLIKLSNRALNSIDKCYYDLTNNTINVKGYKLPGWLYDSLSSFFKAELKGE